MKTVLIGFSCSGKTSVGKLLAEKTRCNFYDTDGIIEQKYEMSVEEFFHRYGEERFRTEENALLESEFNGIVALGGGTVLCPNAKPFLQNAKTVWLKVSAEQVCDRLDGKRPLLRGLTQDELRSLVAERNGVYAEFADFSVDTNGKTVEEVTNEIACKVLQ